MPVTGVGKGAWMSELHNRAPVIIKRRKVVAAEAHHGGAWKVAYADFVTAMMAFFMMLWLLGSTTDVQRKGIADYFAPTVPVSRNAGGAEGLFGGETAAALRDFPYEGNTMANASILSGGAENLPPDVMALDDLERMLVGKGGESMLSDMALRHVVTRLTDEGLVVEVFSLPDAPLFLGETDIPADHTLEIVGVIAEAAGLVRNGVAVSAFVPAQTVLRIGEPVWPLSSARAEKVRQLLGTGGLRPERLRRVTGHADRSPAVENPMSTRNDRFEVTFLRR